MSEDKTSCVVLGEASESEDDELSPHDDKYSRPTIAGKNSIIIGEASESESDIEDGHNIIAEAFKSKVDETEYNSLLHKKLSESNAKLKQDMMELVYTALKRASDQVNEVNQRVLNNQIEIQNTIKHLKRSAVAAEKIDGFLSSIVSQNYLSSINIK